jgi:type II secretory pathway component PulJ
LLSIYLSMLLGLAVWRWFPKLERRSAAPAAQLMKWATLAVAFMVIAWDVMPRRILWETHPVVEFENRTRFVIASTGDGPEDEVLLYLPDEPAQPRVRVRRNTPGLRFLNDKRWLFGRNDSNLVGRSR